MKVIVQYSIADCRHVQNTSGILTYWYRPSYKPPSCFLRNSGSYCGNKRAISGCYYNANNAIKINQWGVFVNLQAKKGINIKLDYRLIYLNRIYATAIYEVCFDISMPENVDFLYVLDELSKLEIRISKSFETVGNEYLKKNFRKREYLTTLFKAKRQIVNHYASITTKKSTLIECGADIYQYIKCFAPNFFVLLGKSEYIHFQKKNIQVGSDGKEEIILLDRKDKNGICYQGYIFVNTEWEGSPINTYSNFSEAISIKTTLDEVLYQIAEGFIRPSQRSEEAELLQGFLKNCLSHFRKEEHFISDPHLKDMIYANLWELDQNFDFENLKRQMKEVINIRPNLLKLVESYLNDIETMTTKKGNVITIYNAPTGTITIDTLSTGDNNIIIKNKYQNLNDEVDKLLKQLKDNNDGRMEEIKADIEAMKAELQSNNKKKAQARLEKIKGYGGLLLDFAKTIAEFLPYI